MKKIILFLGVFYVGLVSAQGIEADINAIIEKAKTGNANAQKTLGSYYYLGSNGVEQSYSKAAYWLERAAEQGDSDAQCNIGVCYSEGKGVEKSYSKAAYWWEKAAEQGDSYAQYNIGVCYNEGEGVEQSYSKAAYWYERAAEQGYSNAQYNIGVCYYNGDGVEQSKTKAIYWFRKACNNFEDKACEALNEIK